MLGCAKSGLRVLLFGLLVCLFRLWGLGWRFFFFFCDVLCCLCLTSRVQREVQTKEINWNVTFKYYSVKMWTALILKKEPVLEQTSATVG